MKTVCVLEGRIIMSQDGDAHDAMNSNAEQYPGAIVEVIDDAEFDARMAAQDPTPGVPQTVTMRQARLALFQQGLLDQVNLAVSSMTGDAGEAARIEWEFSSTVERNRPSVQSLVLALGWSDAQLDALFTLAASL